MCRDEGGGGDTELSVSGTAAPFSKWTSARFDEIVQYSQPYWLHTKIYIAEQRLRSWLHQRM